jgi:hypothetical protein
MKKELANWIYYEPGHTYYCLECVQKRIEEIDNNKEFADEIDYEGGDSCGYCQDYADEENAIECCKCGKSLFSTGIDNNIKFFKIKTLLNYLLNKQQIAKFVMRYIYVPISKLNAKYSLLLIWWRYDNEGVPHKIGWRLFNGKLYIRYRNVI